MPFKSVLSAAMFARARGSFFPFPHPQTIPNTTERSHAKTVPCCSARNMQLQEPYHKKNKKKLDIVARFVLQYKNEVEREKKCSSDSNTTYHVGLKSPILCWMT